MSQDRLKGTHFPKCIILQAIFWYLRYALSYRDIEELMNERGVNVNHSTVQRWVVKYTGMLEELRRSSGSLYFYDRTDLAAIIGKTVINQQ